MANTSHFEVDLETHVYPVLHLARMAISMEYMLFEIDSARNMLPGLDEHLKNLGLLTDYGQSVADYADSAILAATHLLEAYHCGPIFVAAKAGGIEA